MRTIPQTESTGDHLSSCAQYAGDKLALNQEQRDELIADIANDKFREKLAKNDPINLLAAMESFTTRDGAELLEVFLSDAQAFRTLLLARMVELVREDAEVEAIESLEHSERLFNEARLEH